MSVFQPPIEDDLFLLHDVLNVEQLPGFSEWSDDVTRPILVSAARFFGEIVYPINASGDLEGARLDASGVRAPTGFAEAYRRYCEDGWHIKDLPASLGGLGLPPVLANMVLEIGAAANPSFMMYGGTANIVAPALAGYAPKWLADLALPHVLSGAWTGTMCLSEANSGTDLRLMKSRVTAHPDGTYRLNGSKIFISSGDHDLGENIIHVVLAKLPEEDGKIVDDLSSIGCFFVSKRQIGDDGTLGETNGVSVGSIERKMGLKGSSTCVLNFDDAIAWPALPPNSPHDTKPGMAAMFAIMNEARLATATVAVGIASTAVRSAVRYAQERLQSRAPTNRANARAAPDPLAAQPDVRRLILHSASFVEGARMALAQAACWRTLSMDSADDAVRGEADDLLTLFQPVMKAYFSDRAFQTNNDCLQVFGGHGYVHDHGMEQLVRDSRIYAIYEGANGVQAFDLVTRGLRSRGRNRIETYYALVQDCLESAPDQQEDVYAAGLRKSLDAVRSAIDWIDERADDANARAGVSYDVMILLGISLIAYNWTRIAYRARQMLNEGRGNTVFLERKLLLAKLWMEREVSLCDGLSARIGCGANSLMQLDAASF